jgi:hypothetical protein
MIIPGLGIAAGLLASSSSAVVSVNPVNISNKSITKVKTDGTSASASFTFKTDRTVINQDGGTVDSSWLDTGNSPSDYQIRVTKASGDTPGGSSLGTWLSLSSNRTWSLFDGAGVAGTKTCKLTIEIRDAASPNTIRDTATYTLTADSQTSGGTGTATFTPAPGTYSVTDNIDVGEAYFSVAASSSVAWIWSATSTAGLTPSLTSGASGTGINFDLTGGLHADRSTTITLTVGANSWTIHMTASSLDLGPGGP